MDQLIDIGAIDDDLMGLESKALWFEVRSSVRMTVTAASVAAFLAGRPSPRIVTLDLNLGDGTLPADNVRALIRAGHKVIIVTVVPDKKWIIETTEAGASAYLTSRAYDLAKLVGVIEALDRGERPTTPEHAFWLAQDDRPERPRLTPTESQVLRLIGDGIKQETVGRRIGIARSTVATHLTNIRDKYSESGLPYAGAADYRDWARQQELDRDRHDPTKNHGPQV
ncbi:LuxR C-terminal-related transcriptional regulator [Streptomyces sp. NPDC049936]|uniref:LuxR C-terminal-related transcriptional regulator n=1 Tax=Streptomyces sp. NPDC049936 TaxID=3365599 RepID=UPI003788679B